MSAVEIRALAEAEVAVLSSAEPPGRGFAAAAWAAQQRGESTLLVAWEGGTALGHGQLTRAVEPELRNLHVSQAARGRGVGTALVRAAERAAREAGAATLAVGVGDDNPRARALYERLGYVGTGIRSTTTYDYVDDAGVRRTATETDELLRVALGAPGSG
ncbi:hypothetical protein GCM10009846_01790 [Agrococcus versicolor]|uniref:N-acetyltransferase domain-containing protein n=1 Tax=Agrococcus versicolor TaxID=501482 RepID=A0ABP5M991_9MICO